MKSEIIDPGEEEFVFLDARLVAFNKTRTDWDRSAFVVVLRAPDGAIAGGAGGVVRLGAVEVRALWVEDEYRGRGLGRRIMEELEQEARARGAVSAMLDTYGFQAREFYERLGYTCFGIYDYPNGVQRFYMQQEL